VRDKVLDLAGLAALSRQIKALKLACGNSHDF
jgi:hypothetical protein